MKNRFAFLLIALLAVGLMLPGFAFAGDIFHVNGKGAGAFWGEIDEETGAGSGVSVDVFQGSMQAPPGPGQKGTFLFGASWSYTPGPTPEDPGTYEEDWMLFEKIPNRDFSIARDLSSAALNTTVPMGPISISWTGTGELIKDSGNAHFHTPGFGYNSSWRGSWRDAAATGSVFGTDMGPANSAAIYSNRSSDIIIGEPFMP